MEDHNNETMNSEKIKPQIDKIENIDNDNKISTS